MTPRWILSPSLRDGLVVFACEHDLWAVELDGGRARRITTGLGRSEHPALSPDGQRIAFVGTEEGVREVYVIDAHGGAAERVTYGASVSHVVGWNHDGHVVFASAWAQPFVRHVHLHTVDPQGGVPVRLPFGPAVSVDQRADGAVVLGRHQRDLAWWKGYGGGRSGEVWVRASPDDTFSQLTVPTQVAAPQWLGERILFLAETTGDPQLHSCASDGTDLQCHTTHDTFAVRFPYVDGDQVVYVHAGALWRWRLGEEPAPVDVEIRSQQPETQRRFVHVSSYLESVDQHPEGHSLATIVRGRPFVMGLWEGPVRQLGTRDGIRYGSVRFVDDDHLLVTTDEGGQDRLQLLPLVGAPEAPWAPEGMGRVVHVEVDPTGTRAAVADHRNQLWLIHLGTQEARLVETGEQHVPSWLTWSPQGRWLAWCQSTAPWYGRASIRLLRVDEPSADPVLVTDGTYRDVSPSFDPDGKHLHFISGRTFDPVRNEHAFGYTFVRDATPHIITLQAGVPHPFRPGPTPLVKPKASKKDADESPGPIDIDLEGLQERVVAYPLSNQAYRSVWAVGDGTVLFLREPLKGTLSADSWRSGGPPAADLQLVSWDQGKRSLTVLCRVTSADVGRRRDQAVLRIGHKIRVIPTRPDQGQKDALKKSDSTASRRTMFIDLSRIRASVAPREEWAQILDEAWRLMREHFWQPQMGGVDWDAIRDRYRGKLEAIQTRAELSDLIMCMQGELRTSHAYEMGGDSPRPPWYPVGRLGADLTWSEEHQGWQVAHIPRGEPGVDGWMSPLREPGAFLKVGEVLTHIAGSPARRDAPPEQALVQQANTEVELRTPSRTVVVKTLGDDRELRYRAWVLANRERVREQSEGQIGYLHVPDMGPNGYSLFFRDYYAASTHAGLLVDVRWNRGGHISQLLLAHLARPHIGYSVPRWGAPVRWPYDVVRGPMVCVTNEHAGSDGDIFSHGWKRLGLGPLVGTRTWGGVVGIAPRTRLVDRGLTTQPEFSTWFDDVGYGLENRGTEPDVDVPVPPEAWARGDDPQLDEGVALLLKALATGAPAAHDLTRPEDQS